MNFVDLNRRFVRISKEEEPDSFAAFLGHELGGELTWTDLLKHRRVVLLAEAASGKTAEFQGLTLALQAEGHSAFFFAIEEIADHGLLLAPTDAERFKNWKAGTEEASFFLDSIDEARLNRKSFSTALKLFALELGAELSRARVVVSCRVTDWKAEEDRSSIERLLSYPAPALGDLVPDLDAALLDPLFSKSNETTRRPSPVQRPNEDALLIVRMVPLSDEQRRALAVAAGVRDAAFFVTSLHRHGLGPISDRPGDLLELAAYWSEHGQFGSLAAMTEHGVTAKLKEHNKYRPDNDALASARARLGIERLAAALTLAKSMTVRAPGHEHDPGLTAGAIDHSLVLDDWNDAERNALIRRGVFVPATYGRVRLHHRSTQEYLTAAWLKRLLDGGLPITALFNLLFVEAHGVKTVVPSLRPAAAWLALWHTGVRDEILRREPLILIRHGDPGPLPLLDKERLLHTFANRQAAGEIADDRLDHRSLWMFADKDLAGAIRQAWHLNRNHDFRVTLLQLVREGKIVACTDLAREMAAEESANAYYRLVAVEAMAECDDQEGLARFTASLEQGPSMMRRRLAAELATLLFPRHLAVPQLLILIDEALASHPTQTTLVSRTGISSLRNSLCRSHGKLSQRSAAATHPRHCFRS